MAERTFVIAEAGVNHGGSLEMALQLVDVAADAGADAVKFQTFSAERLVTANAARAEYQIANLREPGTQLEMLRRLELTPLEFQAIARRCAQRQVRFMSTAFDVESLKFLVGLGMAAIKIPSGDITCGPMLLEAARLRLPLILSTGMSTLSDIESALGVLAFGLLHTHAPTSRRECEYAYATPEGRDALRRHVTLLHCVTEYPAPAGAVNLRAMDTMAAAFRLPVGYSDHTLGCDVAIAAVARGAAMIEKHYTLDRSLPGPDHAASLEPDELRSMIYGIRRVEQALGDGAKVPATQEEGNRGVARRSLVAARPIREGENFSAESLACKRPGHGVSPMDYWDVLGRRAPRGFRTDELIEP